MRANVPSRVNPRLLVGICLLGLIVLPSWTMGQVDPAKTDKAPAGDPDKQLQALEKRLQEIVKDLQEQRKASATVEYALPVTTGDKLFYLNESLNTGAGDKPDRDKKVQELEAKVQALLKEVQALRGNKNGVTVDQIYGVLLGDVNKDGIVDLYVTNDTAVNPAELTLSRTTYKLPAAKAEALGKFLAQHVKAAVMETKVEGDTLIVTTTPEVQQGLKQFIALIEGKSPHGTRIGRYGERFDVKPQAK